MTITNLILCYTSKNMTICTMYDVVIHCFLAKNVFYDFIFRSHCINIEFYFVFQLIDSKTYTQRVNQKNKKLLILHSYTSNMRCMRC